MSDKDIPPRILSEEEVELYLRGDRREIDRLILLSINRIAATLIPHAERENRITEQLDAPLFRVAPHRLTYASSDAASDAASDATSDTDRSWTL